MKQLTCEMCGSTDLIKKDGVFVCQTCGCKYSVEEARKMMIEGTVSIDGVVKTKNDDFEVRAGELIAYHGAETDVIIPDGIKIIGQKCFAGMQGIESVTIPEGVYKIQPYAFSGCNGLTKISLPQSLAAIDPYAFQGCRSLTSIELPAGSIIGPGCFSRCSSLKSIKLPGNIYTIFSECFAGCTSLESIQLPDSIQLIDVKCFFGCTSLKSIGWPDSIQAVGEECFSGCTSLESIELPDNIQVLGAKCFSNCTSLKSLRLPDGIQTLGEGCFSGCTSIKSIHIPDSVQEIGTSAFLNTPVLEVVELPSSYLGSYIAEEPWGRIKALKRISSYELYEGWGGCNSPWFLNEIEELMESWRQKRDEEERRKNRGCYIATAVYGSYDCPQVWTLRRYRDYTLTETWYGRAFIRVYYAISPALVKWFGGTKWFKKSCKGKLDRMIANLNAEGVEDTPYEDKSW